MNHQVADRKLRIGVLGAGHLGRIHMQQWKEVPEAEVVGFFDPHPEKCEAITAEFGFRSLGSMQEVFDACEAVDVVTPTTAHFRCASSALSSGRHVFIEKPLAGSVQEGSQLVKLTMASGLVAQVGHVERFNPAFVAARGALRDPMFIETHRLAQWDPRGTDVSVVLDLMIHDIDIVLNVIKSPLASVEASGVAVISDTPDIANARLAFENGCVANLTASRISLKKMRKSRFFQRDAYVAVDMLAKEVEIVRMRPVAGEGDPFAITLDLGDKGRREISFEKPEVVPTNAIREELRSFARAVLANTPPEVSVAEGLEALTVAHRVLERVQAAMRAYLHTK